MIVAGIDTTALWETVVAAFLAGVGIVIIFSLMILGAVRFAEDNRDGHRARATVFLALAGLGGLGMAAAVVASVVVMTTK